MEEVEDKNDRSNDIGKPSFVWKGVFQSTQYNAVHGTISAPLYSWEAMQRNAANNMVFDTKITINYSGLYRWGQTSTFPMQVQLETDRDNNIKSQGSAKQFVPLITFKVGAVSGYQSIIYHIVKFSPNKIVGIYQTVQPDDQGSFILEPVGESMEEDDTWRCTIF